MMIKVFMFLGFCQECCLQEQTNTLSMYLEYIRDKLIPELNKLFLKYATWWSFKPNSNLQTYLHHKNIFLNPIFTPEELFTAILLIARKNNMIEIGNADIILPDIKLRECFKSWTIYIPELFQHCCEHVMFVSNEKSSELLNESIINEFYVEPPENIIYSDPSSLFWLHPDVNIYINNCQKIVYSWNELLGIFLDFCTTNNEHLTRKDDAIFFINNTSPLRNIFRFQYFHQNQIENILKQITKFLGKSNTVEQCCSQLIFSGIEQSTFKFIDLAINNFNKLLPSIIVDINL